MVRLSVSTRPTIRLISPNSPSSLPPTASMISRMVIGSIIRFRSLSSLFSGLQRGVHNALAQLVVVNARRRGLLGQQAGGCHAG